jgi:hypothetical protein
MFVFIYKRITYILLECFDFLGSKLSLIKNKLTYLKRVKISLFIDSFISSFIVRFYEVDVLTWSWFNVRLSLNDIYTYWGYIFPVIDEEMNTAHLWKDYRK